jgi:hypothetical protein
MPAHSADARPRAHTNLIGRPRLRNHAVRKIRPVEAAHADDFRIAQLKLREDVFPHALGGGRGEGHERHLGEALAQLDEAPVLGPEVVPPLADAVRLVDGHALDAPFGQALQEARLKQALGSHVEQPVLIAPQAPEPRPGVFRIERRVQERGLDAVRLQPVHLILHQRDQGGDDEGEPLPQHRGKLKTQRLPSARGQEGENIPSRECGRHDLVLMGTEGRIPERILEGLEDTAHPRTSAPRGAFMRTSGRHGNIESAGIVRAFCQHHRPIEVRWRVSLGSGADPPHDPPVHPRGGL